MCSLSDILEIPLKFFIFSLTMNFFSFQICNATLKIKGQINDDAVWNNEDTKGFVNSRLSLSLFEIITFELKPLKMDSTTVSSKLYGGLQGRVG